MKNKVIGLRTIKTAIAVVIAMLVSEYFGLANPAIVAAAVITSMATAIHESFRTSIYRMLSTFLGVVLAVFFQYINFANPFSAGLGVLIIIVFCNFLKIDRAIILSTLIFVSVLTYTATDNGQLINYGLTRLLDTFIGLLIGLTINILLFKPKQEVFLIDEYKKSLELMEKCLLGLLEGLKMDQKDLVDRLDKTNMAFSSLQKEEKIKLNSHVDIINMSELNNKVTLAISLLIDINNQEEPLILTDESRQLINGYFEKKLMKDTKLKNQHLDSHEEISLNFEMRKLIRTMTEIYENLDKLMKIYKIEK